MPKTGTRLRQGGYLAKTCHQAIALDNMPATYPPDLKLPPSPFLQSLFDNGNRFETWIGTRLRTQIPAEHLAMIPEVLDENGERTREGKRAKEEATFAAYTDPDVKVIFNARIGPRFEELLSAKLGREVVDHERISEPDVIFLGAELEHGLRAMTFIDVKWHQICSGTSRSALTLEYTELYLLHEGAVNGLRDFYGKLHHEDWVQLSHYYRHAQTLGLVAAGDAGRRAGVIGKEEIVVWGDLDTLRFTETIDGTRCNRTPLSAYDEDFPDALAVIDNAAARDVDPTIEPLAGPEWSSDCADCPWRDVCLGMLTEHGRGGHITLLPGVTPIRAVPLYRLGITDVATLASWDPLGSDDIVPARHIYAARVSLDGRVHLAPGVDAVDLPRGDIEVDIDTEFTDELVYMWGVRVIDHTTGDVVARTFDDYTETEAGERDIFVAAWEYLRDIVAQARGAGRTVRIYHYSHVEKTKMAGLADKYDGHPGVPTGRAVADLFDSGAVVDLFPILSKQLVWPTRSHSIKKLAVFAGFSWRDETPGGDMSLIWYELACNDPDPAVRDANRTRLREYNGDDVRAQAYLRDWVTAVPLPRVTELKAPA